MRANVGFLRVSSAVVKIAAWISLFFGIIGSVSIFTNIVQVEPPFPRWMGILVLVVYSFVFFVLLLIAKMADILAKIITEYKR